MKKETIDSLFYQIFNDPDEWDNYRDKITSENAGEIFMIALLMQIRDELKEIKLELIDFSSLQSN